MKRQRGMILALALSLAVFACARGQAGQREAEDSLPPPTVYFEYEEGSPQQFPLPLTREQALLVLRKTNRFADVAIGYAGGPSTEACAFATLIREPDADAVFKALLRESRLAGQLYALCGLYFTDPGYFRQAVESYRESTEEVRTQMGCIIGHDSVGSLVESRHPQVVRLSSPEDTVQEWYLRNKERAEEGFVSDIIGGGYPATFRHFTGCLND
jgi:hypothetical protein